MLLTQEHSNVVINPVHLVAGARRSVQSAKGEDPAYTFALNQIANAISQLRSVNPFSDESFEKAKTAVFEKLTELGLPPPPPAPPGTYQPKTKPRQQPPPRSPMKPQPTKLTEYEMWDYAD